MTANPEIARPSNALQCVSTRTQIALGACVCGAATAFLFAVDPSRHAVYPQCLLYNTTGIYCAGCGATRALYALLHCRLLDALHDNVLFVSLLPIILHLAGTHALTAWRANAWPALSFDQRQLIQRGVALFVVMMVFMVARNLPGWPYEFLRPL
jgi:hypothetical protein